MDFMQESHKEERQQCCDMDVFYCTEIDNRVYSSVCGDALKAGKGPPSILQRTLKV
jgi:hypothetical protein